MGRAGPSATRLSAERPHAAGTRGMWLRRPQPRHVIGERHVVPAAAAGFLPGPRVKLLVHRVIRFPLNHLAWWVKPSAAAAGPHQRPGGSPAWVAVDVITAGRQARTHQRMAPAPGRARLGCDGRPAGGRRRIFGRRYPSCHRCKRIYPIQASSAGAWCSRGLLWRSHLRAAGVPLPVSAAAVVPGHRGPGSARTEGRTPPNRAAAAISKSSVWA
jgi:hypothetical protein